MYGTDHHRTYYRRCCRRAMALKQSFYRFGRRAGSHLFDLARIGSHHVNTARAGALARLLCRAGNRDDRLRDRRPSSNAWSIGFAASALINSTTGAKQSKKGYIKNMKNKSYIEGQSISAFIFLAIILSAGLISLAAITRVIVDLV